MEDVPHQHFHCKYSQWPSGKLDAPPDPAAGTSRRQEQLGPSGAVQPSQGPWENQNFSRAGGGCSEDSDPQPLCEPSKEDWHRPTVAGSDIISECSVRPDPVIPTSRCRRHGSVTIMLADRLQGRKCGILGKGVVVYIPGLKAAEAGQVAWRPSQTHKTWVSNFSSLDTSPSNSFLPYLTHSVNLAIGPLSTALKGLESRPVQQSHQ